MASIKDIVDEFETVADAFTGVSTFKYANPAEINEFHDITFPLLMLHKQRSLQAIEQRGKWKTYSLTFGIYDDYNELEKETVDYQTKQDQIEEKIFQFIEEIDTRSLNGTSSRDWSFPSGTADSFNGELIEYFGDQKLIAVEVTINIRVFGTCTAGIFNYA